jgi:ankyrin repeat protein
MPLALPPRPNLDWLKKTAKQKLTQLRVQDASVRLADAQLAVARDYGFASWRKLVRHVEQRPPTTPAIASSAVPFLTEDQSVQAFLRLVGTGHIDEVRQFLATSPQVVNAVGPHPFWGGRAQPLHVAIETNRRDMFDLLLESGADVNGSNDEYDRWSPLMLSAHHDRHGMREELIRRGARLELVEALLLADDRRVEELLQPGASAFPEHVPNGGSILSFARTTFAIDRLLDLGAPIDMKDRWGSTPIESISRLAQAGQPLVRHLVSRGASAAPEEYARLGDRRALEAMIASDRRVAVSDAVMMGAVEFRHHTLVEWLLAHGANVNARSREPSRHTALHAAAWNGDLRMVTLLVSAGADIAARDEEHQGTPRDWADTAIHITNNPACRGVVDYLAGLERSDTAAGD